VTDALVNVLTPEQQTKWKQMIGKPFAFNRGQFRSGFGGPPPDGGRR
jgi:hypothetical protein